MSFIDSLDEFIAKEDAKFKYSAGDKVPIIDLDVSPIIAYDYLFLENGNEHSFHNEELNKISSEEYPYKSDYAIYFEKIKSFCRRTLDESLHSSKHKEHLHRIEPNIRIKKILTKIFHKSLKDEDCPPIMQFSLYTNKQDKKAPRIFCAIGNYAVVYVLFYDPYHTICSSKKLL
jgi:hypothetical protein